MARRQVMGDRVVSFNYERAADFFTTRELENMFSIAEEAHSKVLEGRGPGRESRGWLEYPAIITGNELEIIKAVGEEIRAKAEAFIVIGAGGSYLGGRSALEALNGSFYNLLSNEKRSGPSIFFAGNNLSSAYLNRLCDAVKEKELYLNVISKSGTTLEPALAFRLFRKLLEKKYGREGARERIIVTTDPKTGHLKKMAAGEGYRTFVVPPNVGGRFSVLTAVGLLPMAVGGIDLDSLLSGARQGVEIFKKSKLPENPSCLYAALRNLLYNKGKYIEIFVAYEPHFYCLGEWWKQLFGESEGKDGKGIWPSSLNFTADLHSLGQYMQEGKRNLFATTIWTQKSAPDLLFPRMESDDDGLSYLEGTSLNEINKKACLATIEAHSSGGIPNLKVTIPEINPYYFGQLIYFFKAACAVSGYILGVNPFDQPGVEAYKKKMFELLGRP